MGVSVLGLKFFRFYSSTLYVEGFPSGSKLQPYGVIDIETFEFQGRQVAYAIGGYAGGKFYKRYLPFDVVEETLFEASHEMIKGFLFEFLEESKVKLIYCHNLNYDGHFLLKVLKESFCCKLEIHGESLNLVSVGVFAGTKYSPEDLCKLYPRVLRDTKERLVKKVNLDLKRLKSLDKSENSVRAVDLYRAQLLECFTTSSSKREADFVLKDSFKLLPYSLRELAQLFEVDTQKGVFPYRFVTLETLFYSGVKPDFLCYEDLDFSFYEQLGSFFDVKSETLEYLEKDCRCLYQVLLKFQQFVYEISGVSIEKAFTYSSLAFLIYRHEQIFKGKKVVYRLTRGEDFDIRRGYYGGSCEVFKPYKKGKLYYYDINSLYPACMLKPMPVGKPRSVVVDRLDSFFGFVKCTVEIPVSLKYPVLPVRVDGGMHQYLVTGVINGLWFSEELKYAVSLGCRVMSIEEGYEFDSGDLFSEYVSKYFKIKSEGSSLVQKKVAKLLLNSLYGKVGQNFRDERLEVVYEDQYAFIEDNHKVLSATKIFTGGPLDKVIVEYIPLPFDDYVDPRFPNSPKGRAKASVALSAAISSYGRIRQYQIIRDNADSVYYSDTDSFILDKPLVDGLGTGLGELRLEGVYDEGYFLAPKVYGLRSDEGVLKLAMSGIEKKYLRFEDYEKLYRNESLSYDVKRLSVVNSVIYESDGPVFLSGDFPLKRKKVFDAEGRWIDTVPYDSSDILRYRK